MDESRFQRLWYSRKNLERILDNLKEGIIAHDVDRRIFFFNHEAERVTGYGRKDVLGRDCHDVFGAPFCGDNCSFCDSPPRLEVKKEYTLNTTSRQGEQRFLEMTVTPMQDEGGRLFGVLACFRDMTDVVCLNVRVDPSTGFNGIIGQDKRMMQVIQQVNDVADYDYPVHITGETGTGKELVAAAVHNESRRRDKPFVPINCGALPEGLLESELFGHVKGAFSGAIRDKKGRFELAEGGTIFLDEVAELSKPTQVKLLRFLQQATFEKVGGEETIRVDVRVISATNQNLWQAIGQQRFRDDLYYRLNVIPIHIPALRERKADIPLLVTHFLKESAGLPPDQPALTINKSALALMMDYDWPGNVRELQNAVRYAIVKCRGTQITPVDLPMEIQNIRYGRFKRGPSKKLDDERVAWALDKARGNKAKAARLLGVGRATLYRFLAAKK